MSLFINQVEWFFDPHILILFQACADLIADTVFCGHHFFASQVKTRFGRGLDRFNAMPFIKFMCFLIKHIPKISEVFFWKRNVVGLYFPYPKIAMTFSYLAKGLDGISPQRIEITHRDEERSFKVCDHRLAVKTGSTCFF